MAYILMPISWASSQVMRDLKNRLVGALGMHVQPKPTGMGAHIYRKKCEGHCPQSSAVCGGRKGATPYVAVQGETFRKAS